MYPGTPKYTHHSVIDRQYTNGTINVHMRHSYVLYTQPPLLPQAAHTDTHMHNCTHTFTCTAYTYSHLNTQHTAQPHAPTHCTQQGHKNTRTHARTRTHIHIKQTPSNRTVPHTSFHTNTQRKNPPACPPKMYPPEASAQMSRRI